jgi:hypothetical protein
MAMGRVEFSMTDQEYKIAAQMDPRKAWTQKLEKLTEDAGYFHALGDKHSALFIDEGTTLLVTFDSLNSVLSTEDQLPTGYALAKSKGWSLLSVIADGETWFRDPAVYAFFDRQVDDAFFEDFDNVLFYGAGMGGYAACAYSVAAPGAQVLALNPRATLDPELTRWDTRSRKANRLDFSSRYGYAPDMLEGCGHATVIHDPVIDAEAMQSALFRAPYTTRLSARYVGDMLEPKFAELGILDTLIEQAMQATLTPRSFAVLWRIRRNYLPYLKSILTIAETNQQPARIRKICNSVVSRVRAPRFVKRLAQLDAEENVSPAKD